MPAALPIIAGALSGLSGINKLIAGFKQGGLANKFGKAKRPFQTPEKEFYENVNTAQNIVGSGLPGEGYLRNRLDKIGSGAANKAVMAGQSPSSILSVISATAGQQMDEEAALTYKGADYRSAAVKDLMNTKVQLAGEKKEAWDWNNKQPYLDSMAAASALRNASMLNKQGGLEDLSKIPLLFMGNKTAGGTGTTTGTIAANTTGAASQIPRTSPLAVPDTWSSAGTQEDKNMFNMFVSTNPSKYGKLSFEEFQRMRGKIK